MRRRRPIARARRPGGRDLGPRAEILGGAMRRLTPAPVPPSLGMALAVALVAVLAGCAKFARTTTLPRIQPPVGTGQVQTDFRGDWTVIEVRSPVFLSAVGGGGGA